MKEAYDMLYDSINLLMEEGENPSVVFEQLVDYLAHEVEEHQRLALGYKTLLDLVRNNNPVETIPDKQPLDSRPDWNNIFGSLNDINRQFLLENEDKPDKNTYDPRWEDK